MISTYKELKSVLKQDALANKRKTLHCKPFSSGEKIWKFIRCLRTLEYLSTIKGVRKKLIFPIYAVLLIHFRSISLKLGFSIPLNVVGPGIGLPHYGTIIINGNAKIGKNCRIHDGVTIGATNGTSAAPIIGDNVFLATGAKVIGNLTIANDVAIGANAVVVKSINEEGTTWAGVPAVKISNNNSHANLSPLLELE